MPSLFDRIGAAARVLTGREERGIPPPSASLTAQYGIPALFHPGESLKAYGDNVYLYRAVLSVAMEIARIPLRLVTVRNGEQNPVESHDALDTLRLPQPIQGGKSLLSEMDLKLVTIIHLMLEGEGFWNLDRRKKVNGSPTKVNILMPGNMELKLDSQSDLAQYRYLLPNAA